MSRIKVVGLFQYPVKGMRGNSLAVSPVDVTGLRGDRRLMVVDENGRFITQRECSKLATVAVRYEIFGNATHLLFSALGWEQRASGDNGAIGVVPALYLASRANPVVVTVWSDTVVAYSVDDGEDGIDDCLSMVLERRVRLVHMPDSTQRLSRGQRDENTERVLTSFADGFPFLLTSVESLRSLNIRLADKEEDEVTMDRFRPNIVVEGCKDGFEEETWQEFRIGDVVFYGMKRCGRCIVTGTDQETGARVNKGREPLRTLTEYRRFGNDVCFGMNLNHANTGVIHVGDEVEIVRRGHPFIANHKMAI
ncbi:MAG: MOSC domain-containing protein [bacterium]|nr:MOSC domain-containing protein [bacterium]